MLVYMGTRGGCQSFRRCGLKVTTIRERMAYIKRGKPRNETT
jgi:hypothetical protein